MEDTKKIIGGRIREIRTREPKKTLKEFGAMFGVKEVAVSQWEKGDTMPNVNTLGAIADYGGESIDWLFGREASQINDEESRVLRFFRGSSVEGKKAIRDTAEDIFFATANKRC